MTTGVERGSHLDREGIRTDRAKWNLSVAALYEEAVKNQEGTIAAEGPLVCRTGQHTGRSPNDKFIVREPSSEAHIGWGKLNKAMEQAQWDDDPAAEAAASPEFTVIDQPNFKADPKRHGTSSEVVIALNFAKKLVLVGGTS